MTVGLGDYLKNYREKKVERRLKRLTKRLCEKYAQSYDRYSAADELADMDTEESIYGLLQRFQIQVPKISEDEEERKYIFQLVLEKGSQAIPPILRYLRQKENLAYPLQLLHEIAGKEKMREALLDILQNFAPEYDRAPEKKIDLIKALAEFKDPDIVDTLIPFLEDPQDDVVLVALDALAKHTDLEDRIRTIFLELLLDDEERPRVKRHILDLLKDLHWKVAGFRKQVEEIIGEPYYLDKKGFIKRQGEA